MEKIKWGVISNLSISQQIFSIQSIIVFLLIFLQKTTIQNMFLDYAQTNNMSKNVDSHRKNSWWMVFYLQTQLSHSVFWFFLMKSMKFPKMHFMLFSKGRISHISEKSVFSTQWFIFPIHSPNSFYSIT